MDIVGADGKFVFTVNIRNKTEITIDVSMLSSGTYFARLKKIDGTFYSVEFIKL